MLPKEEMTYTPASIASDLGKLFVHSVPSCQLSWYVPDVSVLGRLRHKDFLLDYIVSIRIGRDI